MTRRIFSATEVIKSYEKKLKCLTNADGNARLRHPLTPALRHWVLSGVTVNEIRKTIEDASQPPKPSGKAKRKLRMKKAPCLTRRGVGSDYSQDHRKLRGLYDPNLNARYVSSKEKAPIAA